MKLICLIAGFGAAVLAMPGVVAQEDTRPVVRPTHTYSIVARDKTTGALGVAVQSHWFSVGARVAWAEAGVGAVATQSFTEVTYGPLGLDLMRAGKTAPEALRSLLQSDEGVAVRQVGMVDADGGVAAHTGARAIVEHCHHTGDGYSVQANLMLKDTVCDAMVRAYEGTEGDLAEKLMRALEAAQAEGGDIRGKQSAALIVVEGDKGTAPWNERSFDLRVDDHAAPVREMRRLLTVARGYKLMNKGDDLWTEGKVEEALKAYEAAEALMPDNHEAIFWHATTLAAGGYVEQALPLYARAYAMWPDWRKVVPRLVQSELLPDDPALIEKIVGAR